ncbi:MAG: hypothetical protein JO187_07250 [Acidobacteria bacterium]|nr:hypothetical protein [Acidobacteriota bacterium]
MQADFSVECAAGDDCLEFPWASGELRYFDLKERPELLLEIAETHGNAELGEFLSAINSPASMLESVKCDAWATTEIMPEEEIFGATHKFASYIDLIFCEPALRFEFAKHENFLRRVARLLGKAPDISSSAEFMLRRCVYHECALAAASESALAGKAGGSRDGFGITFYLFGYGDDDDEARCRWAIGLKLVENALLQLSATHRRGADQTAPLP